MFSGIWVKFKMGLLYHLLWLICWVLPVRSQGRELKGIQLLLLISSYTSISELGLELLALSYLDPSIHSVQEPTCPLIWNPQPRMVAAVSSTEQSWRKCKGHFRGQFREVTTS